AHTLPEDQLPAPQDNSAAARERQTLPAPSPSLQNKTGARQSCQSRARGAMHCRDTRCAQTEPLLLPQQPCGSAPSPACCGEEHKRSRSRAAYQEPAAVLRRPARNATARAQNRVRPSTSGPEDTLPLACWDDCRPQANTAPGLATAAASLQRCKTWAPGQAGWAACASARYRYGNSRIFQVGSR